jgi:hypothetical protein
LLREALAPQSSARQHFSDVKSIAVIVKFVSFLCAVVNKDAQLLSSILKINKAAKSDAWIMDALDSECCFVSPEDSESDRKQISGDALSKHVSLLHRRLLFSVCLTVRYFFLILLPYPSSSICYILVSFEHFVIVLTLPPAFYDGLAQIFSSQNRWQGRAAFRRYAHEKKVS